MVDTIERLHVSGDVRRLMARYVRSADPQRRQDLAGLITENASSTAEKPDGSPWLMLPVREEILR
ncbi:hypothetical protein ACGFRB_24750 [Streptomyces sp. NPDC048718]|uniref:hypothetical protein n=1 Tax=Streptomyces sp. NPDC048718 TaxID=3365587 RepID=UPI00371AB6FD